MKNYVARAMQIACMTDDQVKRLHAIEVKENYLLPNYNIQDLFHLDTIKAFFRIPDHTEAQGLHAQRIEGELKKHSYVKIEDAPEGIEWMHAFDLVVHKNPGKIRFDYVGPRSTGGIKQKYVGSEGKKAFSQYKDEDELEFA